MIGQIAGSYRIVSKLSEGGMGVVYRAEHQMIGRVVDPPGKTRLKLERTEPQPAPAG